ncbi:hypothetical protein K7Z54_23810 [Mycobacterium avium subsp. hominissuis]|uniref:hypothetical protein n=1 Tax=Mycobacterium avium TaxID=1764 RepID=UPI00293A58AA|nr:hypothetical protein [Mycobacterium avium]MDV3245717.1 hypothetical protein [Mycobacterium avium subsp. hominissuis]MDV3276693.1 hypothetical protein [Mycobacterium avium subsp. hominissuis]MDV3324235.1 hypothetical protein [Mycobacterium avium subsp. hominissuis]
MRLQPLPVPTRVYAGEGVVSYSHRHAARNHSQPGEIETGLRQRGIRLRRAHAAAERVEAWRQLGNLNPSAFTTATTVNGDPVTDRRLCLRCTQGNLAIGRLPRVGLVCLRHKRWIGSSPQVDLHAYVAVLTAERNFRNHLAARGVLFDSFAMELGRACADPVFIGGQEIERRRQQTGIDTVAALVYPEQIKFARMLTSSMFLEYVTNPARQASERRAQITREAAKILPVWDDSESWRVTERIWDVARRLTQLRRESLLWGAPVRDAYYNLLRFIDLPDLMVDDKWDDYGIRPVTHGRGGHPVTDHRQA